MTSVLTTPLKYRYLEVLKLKEKKWCLELGAKGFCNLLKVTINTYNNLNMDRKGVGISLTKSFYKIN